jgi:hypothetical protein
VLHPALKSSEDFLHNLKSGKVTKLYDTTSRAIREMTPESEGEAGWRL